MAVMVLCGCIRASGILDDTSVLQVTIFDNFLACCFTITAFNFQQ